MPLPKSGHFDHHNQEVVSKIQKHTTKKAGFAEYVKNLVADGEAIFSDPSMTAEEKVQQFKNAGKALVAKTPEAWSAITANTTD